MDRHTGVVALFCKKSDQRVCNYTRVLQRRGHKLVDLPVQEEQYCFHPGRETLDHHPLKVVRESTVVCPTSLH